MTVRRLVLVGITLVVLAVGCGVAAVAVPASTQGAEVAPTTAATATPVGDSIRVVRAVVATGPAAATTAPTTTLAPATTRGPDRSHAASTGRTVAAVGKPEHLLKRVAEPVPEPVAVTASPQLSESVPPPSDTSPPVADTPAPTALTVTVTTTPPPVTTAPAPALAEPPTEIPATTTVPAPAAAAPPVVDTGGAGQFVAAVNNLRAQVGVGSLARSGDLDARALAWAQYMAGASDLSHSGTVSQLIAEGWSIAGENVGFGPSVDAVFAGLLGSAGHYDNMVNPSFTTVGVGVVVDADGVVWTAHLFAG